MSQEPFEFVKTCGMCTGTGLCKTCGGKGLQAPNKDSADKTPTKCPVCGGSGVCKSCGGRGRLRAVDRR